MNIMMISPKTFAESFKSESLETCMKEKERLQNEINEYEKNHKDKKFMFFMKSSQDIMHHCDKLYLKKLDKVIKKKQKEN